MLRVVVGVVDMGVDKMANMVVDMEFDRWTDREDRCRPGQTTWHICLGKV